jgi:hypothetical protein
MIFEAMVCLVKTMDLSCTEANNIYKWTETSLNDPRHLGVPSGASKMISELTIRSAQIMHLS